MGTVLSQLLGVITTLWGAEPEFCDGNRKKSSIKNRDYEHVRDMMDFASQEPTWEPGK